MKEIADAIAGLQRRKEELHAYIEEYKRVELALSALEDVNQQLSIQANGNKPSSVQANTVQGVTVADLAEEVLREHGGKLRANELLKILKERGHNISQPVLASAIMRHVKKGIRFTRPEKGTYAVKENAAAMTASVKHAGSVKGAQAQSNGAGQRGVAKLVEEILPSLPTEFTRLDIRSKLSERYPERVAKINGDAMRSTLYKLTRMRKSKW